MEVSDPRRFTPDENGVSIYLIGDWLGPSASVEFEVNREVLFLLGFELRPSSS
jgi:hypothetical protein